MVNVPVILVFSPVKAYARSAAGKTGFHAAKVGLNFEIRIGNFKICEDKGLICGHGYKSEIILPLTT